MSPNTTAGSTMDSSSGSVRSQRTTNRRRSPPVVVAAHDAGPTACGGPTADNDAAVRSWRRGGDAFAAKVTLCHGARFSYAPLGASTTTEAPVQGERSSPGMRTRFPRIGRGSSVVHTVTSSPPCSGAPMSAPRASCESGWSALACSRSAATAAETARRANVTRHQRGRRAWRAGNRTAKAARASIDTAPSAETAAPVCQPSARVSAAPAHTPRGGPITRAGRDGASATFSRRPV